MSDQITHMTIYVTERHKRSIKYTMADASSLKVMDTYHYSVPNPTRFSGDRARQYVTYSKWLNAFIHPFTAYEILSVVDDRGDKPVYIWAHRTPYIIDHERKSDNFKNYDRSIINPLAIEIGYTEEQLQLYLYHHSKEFQHYVKELP